MELSVDGEPSDRVQNWQTRSDLEKNTVQSPLLFVTSEGFVNGAAIYQAKAQSYNSLYERATHSSRWEVRLHMLLPFLSRLRASTFDIKRFTVEDPDGYPASSAAGRPANIRNGQTNLSL
jgi:hypothetical protein